MHHLRPGVWLQGKEIKYSQLRQQTFDKRQVTFLVLINLLTRRINLFKAELIFPLVQAVFPEDLLHHFRY